VYREGDDLVLTATKPGSLQIVAQAGGGSSQAEVKVIEGQALPMGSIKWSGPNFAGCKSTQIVPAVPSDSDIDVYDMSRCPDGDYASAYTADGMLVWRLRVGESGSGAQIIPTFGSNKAGFPAKTSPVVPSLPNRRRLSSASVCDGIVVGTEREKVRELLVSRSLSFSSDGSEQIWIVEEPGVQCKLWFDDKLAVARKSKTLVGD